jgi:hypothetical protein
LGRKILGPKFRAPTLAAKYNVKCLLIHNDGSSSDGYDPTAINLDQSNELPALFLSFNLGQELVNALLNSATNTSARMIINVADIPPFPVDNICADTPTGGHIDSVPAGPGINDNGKFCS